MATIHQTKYKVYIIASNVNLIINYVIKQILTCSENKLKLFPYSMATIHQTKYKVYIIASNVNLFIDLNTYNKHTQQDIIRHQIITHF